MRRQWQRRMYLVHWTHPNGMRDVEIVYAMDEHEAADIVRVCIPGVDIRYTERRPEFMVPKYRGR